MSHSHTPNTILRSVLYGGGAGKDHVERGQVFVLNAYMIIALVCLFVFGGLHITEGDQLLGSLEWAICVVLALNIVGLRATGNVGLARTGFLLAVITALCMMLTTGGTQGTGIFWFYTFPVIAFFLAGTRQGLRWMAGLYGMTLGVLLLDILSITHIPYAFITIRQLLLSLAVVAIGIYAYQVAREKALAQVHDVDRAKSEFVALASHQLRTPISAIGWFSEMLLKGDTGKLTDEQFKEVEQIYRSNQRMTLIINDMLIVSSLELGNLPIKPVKSDLADLTHRVLESLQPTLLLERKLTIHETYGKHLPEIAVDPSIIKTVIHNLLSNAIKYTPDGGTITLRVRRSSDKLHRGSKGSLYLEIKDTGYGIPPSAQDKLFTKFFRASNITHKDTDGTGLGLFIVKNLLEYAGGGITFTSEENKGSTFSVQIPLEGMRVQEDIKPAA